MKPKLQNSIGTVHKFALPLRIAFAYAGAVGDGGWSYAHDVGRRQLENELGDKIITTYVENVPESADAERVFRDLINQGNKLIIGTTFGYMEPMLNVARSYPSVYFENATGYKTARNLRTYDIRMYQGAYLAGLVAGRMSRTNVLGFIASVPIPEVIRNINSFTLGARRSNPSVRTKVLWVNEWYNPPNESRAAGALVDVGADILIQNTDSPGVLQTALARGVKAFGWDSDMTQYAPAAHIGSVVGNWGPYYIHAALDVLNGAWSTGQSWWGIKEGAVDLVALSKMIPADLISTVRETRDLIGLDAFDCWRGPIYDNGGRLMIQSGYVPDDRFLGGMNFYVNGVEGEIPRSN
jgi:simple sugar transport system substrate-binding protein